MTYSVEQVAQRYGVSPRTVLAWIAAGELRATNVSRNARSRRPRWRINEAALDAFEAARAATPPPAIPMTRRRRPGDAVKFY